MESRLHKQFQSLLTSYYFVEVVFVWRLFPHTNKLFNFKVVVLCILRYMIYIVLSQQIETD